MATAAFTIGFSEGFATPLFMLAEGVLLIVIIDAHGMRRKIGEQAKLLNTLQQDVKLREKMGHSYLEIAGGLVLGAILGYAAAVLF